MSAIYPTPETNAKVGTKPVRGTRAEPGLSGCRKKKKKKIVTADGRCDTLTEAEAKVNALIAEIMEPEAKMEVTRNSKLIRTKVPSRGSQSPSRKLDVVQFSPTEFELIGLTPGRPP